MAGLLVLILSLVTTVISHAGQDGAYDMCAERGKPSGVCECASERLKSEIGDDYALYASIGSVYLANKQAGMAMGDAWDAAVKSVAGQRGSSFTTTLQQTNDIGKAHRKAMKNCAQ